MSALSVKISGIELLEKGFENQLVWNLLTEHVSGKNFKLRSESFILKVGFSILNILLLKE